MIKEIRRKFLSRESRMAVLEDLANDAIKTFRSAIAGMGAVNQEVAEELVEVEKQMDQLQGDHDKLNEMLMRNTKVISKMSELLPEEK